MAWETGDILYQPLRAWVESIRTRQEWHKLEDVAKLLGVPSHTLHYRMRHKEVIGIMYAKVVYIRHTELERIQRQGLTAKKRGPKAKFDGFTKHTVYIPQATGELIEGLGEGKGLSAGIRRLAEWYQQQGGSEE